MDLIEACGYGYPLAEVTVPLSRSRASIGIKKRFKYGIIAKKPEMGADSEG